MIAHVRISVSIIALSVLVVCGYCFSQNKPYKDSVEPVSSILSSVSNFPVPNTSPTPNTQPNTPPNTPRIQPD